MKITAMVALSWLLLSVVPAAAPKSWTITQVLHQGSLIGITNSGRVLGRLRVQADPMFRPFVWHRGELTELPLSFTPADINDSGQVVGRIALPGVASTAAAVWDHGTLDYLAVVPGYTDAYPAAINNLGQVVGRVGRTTAAPPFWESLTVLWSYGSVIAIDGMGMPFDINDNGQIVGASPDMHAVRWEGGTLTRLPQPYPDLVSAAVAINNRGLAVGYSVRYDSQSPAVLWDRGSVIELPPPDSRQPGVAVATSINERGQVVGYFYNHFNLAPLIWEDGVATRLSSGGQSWYGGLRAVGINNRGDIIGNNGSDFEFPVGVLWTR